MFLVERITRTGSVSVGNESRNWRTPIIFISLIGVGTVILQFPVERDARHIYPALAIDVPAPLDLDLIDGGLTQRAILNDEDGSGTCDFDVRDPRLDSRPGEHHGSVSGREIDRGEGRPDDRDHFWIGGVAVPLIVGFGERRSLLLGSGFFFSITAPQVRREDLALVLPCLAPVPNARGDGH